MTLDEILACLKADDFTLHGVEDADDRAVYVFKCDT
jgi:hypothetical protein